MSTTNTLPERRVGESGLRVSAIGLGCNNFGWKIDEPTSRRVVDAALEAGITTFDTADYYGDPRGGSESILGRALGTHRRDVVLMTKFGLNMRTGARDGSRRYVLSAVEDSLRRLSTDWIDVYMIHWPDDSTPVAETLSALDDLVTSGKVRYIACSNLSPWRLVDGLWTSRQLGVSSFIATEDEYSLLARGPEQDLIPAARHHGVGLFPYYPLASGLLSGKYVGGAEASGRLAENFLNLGNRFMTPANLGTVAALDDFARERGHTLLELAVSWLLANPVVASVICGATTPEQIEANVRAGGWELTADELASVDEITRAPR